MTKSFLTFLLAAAISGPAFAADPDPKPIDTAAGKVSYGVGVSIGSNMKRQSVGPEDLDFNLLAQGIRDALTGTDIKLSEDEIRQVLTEFQTSLADRQRSHREKAGQLNKEAGAQYLAANKERPGVKTLPSGLQYEVIKAGAGESPNPDDTVVVHYKGTLTDGTEFDSSYSRGQPASFKVNGVIQGWSEALQLMKPGAQWKLYIPSELAYKDRGAGDKIGPNAVLVFDVELIEIKRAEARKPAQPVTSDIIKVPSAAELEKGAKIEIIKASEVEKEIEKQRQEQKKADQPKN